MQPIVTRLNHSDRVRDLKFEDHSEVLQRKGGTLFLTDHSFIYSFFQKLYTLSHDGTVKIWDSKVIEAVRFSYYFSIRFLIVL